MKSDVSISPIKPLTDAIAYFLAATFIFVEVIRVVQADGSVTYRMDNWVVLGTVGILVLAGLMYLTGVANQSLLIRMKSSLLEFFILSILFGVTTTQLAVVLAGLTPMGYWLSVGFVTFLVICVFFGSRRLLFELKFLVFITPTFAAMALATYKVTPANGLWFVLGLLIVSSSWTAFVYLRKHRRNGKET